MNLFSDEDMKWISEIVSAEKKNRFDSDVPDDARPGYTGYRRMCINPHDKYERNSGFNFKESGEFSKICALGPEQIIACYRFDDKNYDAVEIYRMCEKCKYRFPSMNYWFGPDAKVSLLDESVISIWSPKYINLISNAKAYKDGEEEPGAYVYFITDGHKYVKIGKAINPESRIRELQVGSPVRISILCAIPCADEKEAIKLEGTLHVIYNDYRASGEWFSIYNKLDVEVWEKEYPFYDCDEVTKYWEAGNTE